MLPKSLEIKQKKEIFQSLGSTYYNLAKAYQHKNDLTFALENAKSALKYDKRYNQEAIEDDISLIEEIKATKQI